MLRYLPFAAMVLLTLVGVSLALTISFHWLWLAVPALVLSLIGTFDLFHPTNNLLRIYPLLAYGRFASEQLRPELYQYFIESDIDGAPFNRNARQMVYERAAREHQERSFGTELDVYQAGYEWLTHSIAPKPANDQQFRVTVGGGNCASTHIPWLS